MRQDYIHTFRQSVREKSEPVLKFKREQLSMLRDRTLPVMRLGDVDVRSLIELIKDRDLIATKPSKSLGFSKMSEYWLTGDVAKEGPSELDEAMGPIKAALKRIVSFRLKTPMIMFKCVIDTIDSGTCILPHGDDFFHHLCALRVHVPIRTSPGSIGLSLHPDTLDPFLWRMGAVGRAYAFNNFEPHTVTKLDEGVRSHLICDMFVANSLRTDLELSSEEFHEALFGRCGDLDTSPNFLTVTESNFRMRNRFNAKHGLRQFENNRGQLDEQNVNEVRPVIQALAASATPKVF